MSLNTLVSVANLVSSLAVVISLIYLSRQIRQGADNQRSIMDRGRSEQVGEWLQYIAREDTTDLILRGHAGDPTLTPTELHRYLWSMYPLFLHFEDSFYQHRSGMIGDGQYASIVGHLRSQCTSPGFRALWAHIRMRFPDDFRSFFDNVVETTDVDSREIASWTANWHTLVRANRDSTSHPQN